MIQCAKNNHEIAMALVQRGAKVGATISTTPEFREVLEDVYNKLWNTTPLLKALHEQNIVVFRALLKDNEYDVREDFGGSDHWSILHAAVYLNQIKYVKLLVESGRVDIMAKSQKGHTALHFACSRGYHEIIELLAKWVGSFWFES